MFNEDLSVFFSDFAESATVRLPGGDRSIKGLFDNGFFDTRLGEVVMDTTQPRFTCKLSDALMPDGSYIPRGTPFVLAPSPQNKTASLNFSVLTVEPEGTGCAVIMLAPE